MERFKLAVLSILFIKLLIIFPSSNGDADYDYGSPWYLVSNRSEEELDYDGTNHLITTSQPNAGVPTPPSNITDLLIPASEGNLGTHRMDTIQKSLQTSKENGRSLDDINQINNLAEEKHLLTRAFLNILNERIGNNFDNIFQAKNTRPNLPKLTDCGGSLSSRGGSIIYEYNPDQSQNCLWVISSQLNRDYLNFTLDTARLSGNRNTQLSVGYFNNSQFDKPDTLFWTKFDQNSVGGVTLEVPSAVAFVHLVSTTGSRSLFSPSAMKTINNGFILNFEGIQTNSTPSPLTFTSSFQNNWGVKFGSAIPGHNATTYASNQITLFAFQPPKAHTSLYIKWYDLENKSTSGAVYDSLNIWAFERDHQWHRVEQLYGRQNKEMLRPFAKKYDFSRDASLSPMMITFQTDSSLGFSGFEGYMAGDVFKDLPELKECGGSLSSKSGLITYEYNPDQSQNCIWVISSQLNTDYIRFSLDTAKFQGNRNTHLAVGYFNNSQFDKPDTLLWRKFDENSVGGVTLEVPSAVAFVHLVSTPGPRSLFSPSAAATINNGFILSFEGIPTNSSPSALTVASSFQNSWDLKFSPKLPGHNATTYASNQITLFAFQPPKPNTSLYIKWYDLEDKSTGGGVYDSLNIWAFGRYHQWHRVDQLYGRQNKEMLRPFAKKYDFSHDASLSPIIATFQTDASLGFTGFEGYMGRTVVQDAPKLADCGGSHSSRGGSIIYEFNPDQTQSCIWVISSQANDDHIRFSLDAAKLQGNGSTYLSVGYFKDAQFNKPDTLLWRKLDRNLAGGHKTEIPSAMAFVHLVSRPGPRDVSSIPAMINSGFILNFEGIQTNSTPSALTFASSFQNSWNVKFSPMGPGHNLTTYASNRRTVFALQPPKSNTSLYIKWYDIEREGPLGTISDSLNIWAFGPNLQWRRVDQLHGEQNTDGEKPYAKKYDFNTQVSMSPMIVAFHTNDHEGFTGFEGYMGETVVEDPNTLNRCGGSRVSGNGSIIYEYNQAHSRNCLWVFSPQYNSQHLRFTLEAAKLQGNGNVQLSVGYFNNSQFDKPDSLIWRKFDHTSTGKITLEVPSTVALVHLVSTPGPGAVTYIPAMPNNRFVLHFRGISGSTSSLAISNAFYDRLYTISRVLETNQTVYGPNKRSIITFQPRMSNTSLYIKWHDIENNGSNGTVYDSLNVWAFNRNHQWHRVDQLYGKLNTDRKMPFAKKYDFNIDRPFSPMFLTFQTDGSEGFTGYEAYMGDSNVKAPQIRLYVGERHTGRSQLWNLQGNECVDVKPFLQAGEGFKSLTTLGSCVKICDRSDCTGTCHLQYPGTLGHWKLDKIGFSNRVQSIQSCI